MATVSYLLNHPKKNGRLRQDPVSIVVRLSKGRAGHVDVPTDEKISPLLWDFEKQQVKSRERDHIAITLHLQSISKNLLTLYRENRHLTFQEFKVLAQGKAAKEKKSLLPAFDAFVDVCRKESEGSTVDGYLTLRVHLADIPGLTFESLDWNFIDAFRSALFARDLKDSTVAIYVARLRTFLEWAKKRGYPVDLCYQGWPVRVRRQPVISLTAEEQERLKVAIMPYGPSIGRDILLVESIIGLRISNLLKFDPKDVIDSKWTVRIKKGNRRKAREIIVHFRGYCKEALEILMRVYPYLATVNVGSLNRWIKEAGRLAKIDAPVTVERWENGNCNIERVPKWKTLSTHNGRKTFITLGLQYMEAKVVKDLAGIRSWRTLEHYEGETEQQVAVTSLEDMGEKLQASKAKDQGKQMKAQG